MNQMHAACPASANIIFNMQQAPLTSVAQGKHILGPWEIRFVGPGP